MSQIAIVYFRLDNTALRNGDLYKMNLFRSPHRQLEPWVAENDYYCMCDKGEIKCMATQHGDCTFKRSITETKCGSVDVTRGRRSVNSHKKEMERLFQLMHTEPTENIEHNSRVKVGIRILYKIH